MNHVRAENDRFLSFGHGKKTPLGTTHHKNNKNTQEKKQQKTNIHVGNVFLGGGGSG
jgi:hypothetical protein